jgi:hypothetical protein
MRNASLTVSLTIAALSMPFRSSAEKFKGQSSLKDSQPYGTKTRSTSIKAMIFPLIRRKSPTPAVPILGIL